MKDKVTETQAIEALRTVRRAEDEQELAVLKNRNKAMRHYWRKRGIDPETLTAPPPDTGHP